METGVTQVDKATKRLLQHRTVILSDMQDITDLMQSASQTTVGAINETHPDSALGNFHSLSCY